MKAEQKIKKLEKILKSYQKIAIAFSGGSDSLFLLHSAVKFLGKENVLALTARGDFFPKYEENHAQEFVSHYGINHVFVDVVLEENKGFADNDKKRCYFCKKNILGRFIEIAAKQGFSYLGEGTNADDLNDVREGFAAVKQCGVLSPLLDAGLTKKDMVSFLKSSNMDKWLRPSQACLASRVPYGQKITKEVLKRIEKGEDYLRGLGVTQVRLRHHGNIARIEIMPDEFNLVLSENVRKEVAAFIKGLGYKYVTLDLSGFVSGSMN